MPGKAGADLRMVEFAQKMIDKKGISSRRSLKGGNTDGYDVDSK